MALTLVPIEDKIFLKEEGYFTLPAAPSSPEPIPVPPGPSTLPEVSKEEVEQQVQEVAKFFEQLGGAPAVVIGRITWRSVLKRRGKGRERKG